MIPREIITGTLVVAICWVMLVAVGVGALYVRKLQGKIDSTTHTRYMDMVPLGLIIGVFVACTSIVMVLLNIPYY